MTPAASLHIKKIELLSKRLVSTTLSGNYLSAFKGSGIDFHQLREYQAGDDIRLIHWNSSLKTDRLMIKQFIEERDRTIIVLIDLSASMSFSSCDELKSDMALQVASTLAAVALKHNDRVGALFFTDQIEAYLTPKRGMSTLASIIEKMVTLKPKSKKSSLASAFNFLIKLKKRNAIVFCISDWIDQLDSYQRHLSVVSKKHDIIAVRILDKTEINFPAHLSIELRDPESNRTVDLDGIRLHKALEHYRAMRLVEQKRLLQKLSIDVVTLHTGTPFISTLSTFFHERTRKR